MCWKGKIEGRKVKNILSMRKPICLDENVNGGLTKGRPTKGGQRSI